MKFLAMALFALLPYLTYAQLKIVAEGPIFEEPENGYARIILLENGNTAFIHVTKKDGINVRIYNTEYKEICNKPIIPSYGKLKGVDVEAIYDIAGNIVTYISELDEKTPTLYRVTINSKTGDLIETKTISTLKKYNIGQGYAMAFGGVPMPNFIVRKDPMTQNCAVARFNAFSEKRDERAEVILYGEDGLESYRTFISSPDTKYKYTQLLDFVVIGKDIYALLYSYNTPKSGGAANELLLASVKGGIVTYQNIGKSLSKRINDGILRYNPKTGNLVFVTLEQLNTENKGFYKKTVNYAIQFNIIGLNNPTIKTAVDTRRSSISSKYRKIFKDDEPFVGMPQQIYINEDGSFTLVMEEVVQKYREQSMNGIPTGRSYPIGSELGSIAVISYNEDGTEKSCQVIPKLQTNHVSAWDQADYTSISNFYIAERDNSVVPLSGGNQFKSFVYLHSKNKPYILMNDVAENEERILKGKLTNVKGVGDCEGYMYDLTESVNPKTGVLPRKLVFKKEDTKDRNLAIFSISEYNREKNLFATLKLEKGKGVRLVWMKD